MLASPSMELDPGQLFRTSFTRKHQELIVGCLQRAAATAREAHFPERGGNESTFGFGLYNYAVHELAEAARLNPDMGIGTMWPNQAFRLSFGPYRVACHKVGNSAGENIWGCFPNPGASHSMVMEQGRPQWLPGLEPTIADRRSVVIAYMCSLENGLEAVYLCIPTREARDRITEWGYAQQIWAREGEEAATTERFEPAQLPAEELVPEPMVSLKPSQETGS